jgi:glycosyltransferase 2 family protein
MRKFVILAFQTSLSICLLWRDQFTKVFSSSNPSWLALGLVTAVTSETLCAIRWWIILRALRTPIPIRHVAIFSWAGLFYSLGLPGGAGGDAFRIAYACRMHPKRKALVSISVLADRVSGFLALALSFLLMLLGNGVHFLHQTSAAPVIQGAACLLSLTSALLAFWWIGSLRCIDKLWMPPSLRRLRFSTRHFTRALRVLLGRPQGILLGTLLSFLSLTAHFSTYFCSAKAVGASVTWIEMCQVMCVADVLVMLPITFFGVGLRETLLADLLGGLHRMQAAPAILISMGGFVMQATVGLAGSLCIPFTTTLHSEPPPKPSIPQAG